MEDLEAIGIDSIHLAAMGILILLLAVSVFTELKDHRIPNWLTLSGAGMGLFLGYLPGGADLASSIIGFAIGFGVLFIFYVFGGMGGGDVKLMGAVGALQGSPLIFTTVVYTALIGGVMAVFILIWHQKFWSGMGRSIIMFFRSKKAAEAAPPTHALPTVPYGLAIAAGTVLTLFLSD